MNFKQPGLATLSEGQCRKSLSPPQSVPKRESLVIDCD